MSGEDSEWFVNGPEGCTCGRLYVYGGVTEPGQFNPDCPTHKEMP